MRLSHPPMFAARYTSLGVQTREANDEKSEIEDETNARGFNP